MAAHKGQLIQIRISPEEKAKWESAAKKAGMGLSEYIRLIVGAQVRKDEK